MNHDELMDNLVNQAPDCGIDEDSDADDLIDTDETTTQTPTQIHRTHIVSTEQIGMRLDKLCADIFGDFSRANLKKFIDEGQLTVNGKVVKPKYAVKMGDILKLEAVHRSHSEDLPENIDIDIIYEDEAVIIINKPAGMVVHPGAGNRTGTLVNALLYHFPKQAHLPRAGLVHRIDKDTTGLLVIARTKSAQLSLIDQLKDKSVYRHYQCIALGAVHEVLRHAQIDASIGRHSTHRTKMAVKQTGKPALTHIVNAKYLHERYSLLDIHLKTGRTHQIRVHLSYVGHPLVGDPVYGTSPRAGLSDRQRCAILDFGRQALHAYMLGFIHPVTGEAMKFHAPLPKDMQQLIEILNDDAQ